MTDPTIAPPKTVPELRRLRSWLLRRNDGRRHLRLSVADGRALGEDPKMVELMESFHELALDPKEKKVPALLYGFDITVDPELEAGTCRLM